MENDILSHCAKNAPVLEKDFERKLFRRLCDDKGDEEAFRILFESHIRLVYKEVSRVLKRQEESFQDCLSVGCIGLMTAIQKFKLNQRARLSTYAKWWIRSEVLKFMLQNASLHQSQRCMPSLQYA